MAFVLRFPAKKIGDLANRYPDDDAPALKAGSSIRVGAGGFDDLRCIFNWKTGGRGRSRLERNSMTDIVEALALLPTMKADRLRMGVLCALHGIDVPVASAILAMTWPDDYTVIDFRALESLGTRQSGPSIAYYLKYLQFCRELAERAGVDLRTLDRALWQHSKEAG